MNDSLRYEYRTHKIDDLIRLYESGCLNLEPGFQRNSVWSASDRGKLIKSIMQGYPIPSIFLYEQRRDGRVSYDVIDGKQRLETILMFTKKNGFSRQGFAAKVQLPGEENIVTYDWAKLGKEGKQEDFLAYRLTTTEVSGPLADIIDLFVRINSTGKALAGAEKRNAQFYKSPFLAEAHKLARQYQVFLTESGIISPTQSERMKDVELLSELLASVVQGGLIDRKVAIDRAIANKSVHASSLRKSLGELKTVLNLVKTMFPELRSTRFRNVSEFYSLTMVLWQMRQAKLILTDKQRNATAQDMLLRLSQAVDDVRERQRQIKSIGPGNSLAVSWLTSVQQGTDKLAGRQKRAQILQALLENIFQRKDEQRCFSPEARRLLWNSEDDKVCSQCDETLDWTRFHVDHVKAHSKGGRTSLENAALICASCNSSKGARRTAAKRTPRVKSASATTPRTRTARRAVTNSRSKTR